MPMAPSSVHETSPLSPTLSNPALILPNETDATLHESHQPNAELSYALGQFRPPDDCNERLAPGKSVGKIPQSAGLKTSIMIPSSFDIDSDAGLSALTEESNDNWKAPWEKPKSQRPLSIVSASSTSLDLDAIPDYKHDDAESDIFTVDYHDSGKRSPTKDRSDAQARSAKRNSSMFSTDLSRRADLILANAKERLNLMDQNLRGARALTSENLQRATSLHVHESPYASRYFKPSDGDSAVDVGTIKRVAHMRNRSDITHMQSPARSRRALISDTLPEEPEESMIKVATVLRVSRSQELPRSPRAYTAGRPSPHDSPTADAFPAAPLLTDDLRSKVESLNQRISVLRTRTKADSMRRRSNQSLRQASPFTDAESDPPRVHAGARHSVDPVAAPAEAALASVAGSIVSEGKAHEDRPDAFDYRTCFLHSSLGSRTRLSGGSDGTMRGAGEFDTPDQLRKIERGMHARLASYDSTISAASFATAATVQPLSPVKRGSVREVFTRVDSGTVDSDQVLVKGLMEAVRAAGEKIKGEQAVEWRRRIEAARRILDGSMPL